MAPRPLRFFLAGLIGLLSFSATAEESQYGRNTASAIRTRIELQQCDGAVADLKTGLKKEFPEVALLAGSMYDNGICVKRDWDRAVAFYVQAWQGGMKEGADRLAAGYAAPEHGPDTAAALWWASRQRSRPVKGCTVSPANIDDPDRFVAELQAWPQQQLVVCNYITGVMSMVSAETQYPEWASDLGVGGEVGVRFLPAVPGFEWKKGATQEYRLLGLVDGDNLRGRGSRAVTGGFEKSLREVADRALRRYPHPAGIPAETTVEVQYVFSITRE
jgi:hypothetical protein